MAITSTGETAKIVQFPAGGRKLGGRRFDKAATVAEFQPKHVMVVDYHSWYHDEAVREEQKPKS
ncbi:DUF2735 domain-containing protein [Pararhizobium sp. O133]|uniref:DUF2735 domain-containing protein n=1 Tax=Pararhizobium sp. O133 TaxID=3449278 RepID=UPI003F684A8D